MTDQQYVDLLEKQNEQLSAILNGRLLDVHQHVYTVIGFVELNRHPLNQVILNRMFGVFDNCFAASSMAQIGFDFFKEAYDFGKVQIFPDLQPCPPFPDKKTQLKQSRGCTSGRRDDSIYERNVWDNNKDDVLMRVDITIIKTKFNTFLGGKSWAQGEIIV